MWNTHLTDFQGKKKEKSLERMWASPDGEHLVFAGHDGVLMLVSRKVSKKLAIFFMLTGHRQSIGLPTSR